SVAFDVEAQKKIEAAIRQGSAIHTPFLLPHTPFGKGIDENWAAALEHNPEAFAGVVMLYVDMEVNGVPLKAFVDSGAQSTIISKSCAERCGYELILTIRLLFTGCESVFKQSTHFNILLMNMLGSCTRVSCLFGLAKKGIPSRFLDEERFSKEASSSGAPVSLLEFMLFLKSRILAVCSFRFLNA
ncbi:hypothetical protein DVH24_004941, partial [Malus domestica]